MSRFLKIIIASLFLTASSEAVALGVFGSIWYYFSQYQLGISRSYVLDDEAEFSYSTAENREISGSSCKPDIEKQGYLRCSVKVKPDQNSGNHGYGIYLQRAFKRKGFFYYDADVAFSLRKLEGRWNQKEDQVGPLENIRFNLYGGVIQPYLQLGITPQKYWPDFLISFGPVAQWLWGNVKINEVNTETGLAGVFNWSGTDGYLAFLEAELVLFRMGEGSFSLFVSRISGNNKVEQGALFPTSVDGMTDFEAGFSRYNSGLKILLNWP